MRYIGIDTPEVHGGVEWLGREASQSNAELVSGRQVVLEKDVSETASTVHGAVERADPGSAPLRR